MKKIVLKLYEFDELSKDSQESVFDYGLSTDNVIYYNHTNTLSFNWRDYGEKITQEEFDDFVNNVDRSQLPEGIKFELLNTNGKYLTSHYASWKKGSYLHLNNGHADQNNIERYRFATEDERQKFIDALKISKEPKAEIYLKQFFGIEIEPKYKFKPFDKVLVRDTEDDDWHVSLFAREIADAQYKEEKYECLNGTGWIYCIPFEGNEHLL